MNENRIPGYRIFVLKIKGDVAVYDLENIYYYVLKAKFCHEILLLICILLFIS